MKHFITADIEAPHRSYYAFIDPPCEHFLYKWAWAGEDGGPPEGALFFDDLARAEEVVASLKESGGGLGQHADSIEVTSLEVD